MFQLCPLEGRLGILGTLVVMIAGFFMEAIVFAVLGIDWANVPLIVIILLWGVFSAVAALFVD